MTTNRVRLVEQSGRLQTFNLPHDQFCVKVGACTCRSVVINLTEQSRSTGARRLRPTRRRLCASLTLLPGQTSDPLPAAVLEVDEVRAAINSRPRRLAVVTDEPR